MTGNVDLLEDRLRQTFHEVATSQVVAVTEYAVPAHHSNFNGGPFPRRLRITSIAFALAIVVAVVFLVFVVGPFKAKTHIEPVGGGNTPESRFEAALNRTSHLQSYELTSSGTPQWVTLYDGNKTESLSDGSLSGITSGSSEYIPLSAFSPGVIGPRCVIHAKFLSTGGFTGVSIDFASLPGSDPLHSVFHQAGNTYTVSSKGEGRYTYTVRNDVIIKIVMPQTQIRGAVIPTTTLELSKINQPIKIALPSPSEVEPLMQALTAPGCSTNGSGG